MNTMAIFSPIHSASTPILSSDLILAWLDSVESVHDPNALPPSPFPRSRKRKASPSVKPLQPILNLCTRTMPSPLKDKTQQSGQPTTKPPTYHNMPDENETSPRRSMRNRSPTSKAKGNQAAIPPVSSRLPNANPASASHTQKVPTFHSGSNTYDTDRTTKSPVKVDRPIREKPDENRERGRGSYIEDETENTVLSDLATISFHATEERTTDRTRSSSPNKEIARMGYYNPPITILHAQSSDHPACVTTFLTKFKATIKGKAVIPAYLKDSLDAERLGVAEPDDFNYGQQVAADTDSSFLWSRVKEIKNAADECREYGGYEGNWIDLVVKPLVELTLRHGRFTGRIRASNVDMVQVQPRNLLPLDPQRNQPVPSRKIDIILALELPSDRVAKAFARWADEDISFNQSSGDFHRRMPIFTNIEVKRTHGIEPLVQLGIWSAAGFQKRSHDGDEKNEDELPTLLVPGSTVVGDLWTLYVAYKKHNGSVVLAGPITIGLTNSYLGIFQIINCIQVLSEWGLGEYNTWLEDVVWKRLEHAPTGIP